MSAGDLAILGLESETVAGHTGKVVLVRGRVDIGQLRAAIAARLDRAPALGLRLADVGGEAWWVPDPLIDIGAHVVQSAVAGDEAGFTGTVAGIFSQHLDRSRPLWRIDVVPRRSDGGTGLVWRIHHALADGITAMRMARAVLWDDQPAAREVGPAGRARPGSAAAGASSPRRAGGLLAAVREAPRPWLRSPFDGHVDACRSVAFASAGLDGLRRAAHAAEGATVNDAVLTVVSGGLRRWLEARHGQLGAVRVKVPVSLHGQPAGAREQGNRDSFFCLDLPLDPADPLARLTAIRRATRVRKQDHDAQHIDALMRHLARTPRLDHFAQRVLAHPRSFALNVSNVPGPPRPVDVLGEQVGAVYSLAEIGEHHALRVAVVSFADELNFGFVADPTLLPDVGDLAADVRAEAALLAATARRA